MHSAASSQLYSFLVKQSRSDFTSSSRQREAALAFADAAMERLVESLDDSLEFVAAVRSSHDH